MDKGYTLMHEHITIDLSRIKNDPDTILDTKEETIKEFKELYDKGVRNILDLTNRGMGRYIRYIEEVSQRSGINIIAATGFYKEPFLPDEVYNLSTEELAQLMIDEIEKGIDGTNIKAHVIGEIGTSFDEWTEAEKKVFDASLIAHRKTGAIISTHTSIGKLAIEQLNYFKKHEIDLSKVIIGHQDLNTNDEEVFEIVKSGATVGFDTIGKNNYRNDEDKINVLLKIQEKGFIDNVILSMDITRKSHLKVNGGLGYSYILDTFLPMARERGLTEESINKMLIHNPERLLRGN